MILFLTSFSVVVVMFLEKMFFFRLEGGYASSFWGILEIALYILTTLVGVFFFIKEYFVENNKPLKQNPPKMSGFFDRFNLLVVLFGLATLCFIGLSFYLNYVKVSIHWDAVALYDARAKFLASGMKFSEMPSLAKYDNLNQYYYLLYPPYTSIAHYMWRAVDLTRSIPVSVYYSVVLVFLTTIILLVSKEAFGILIAITLAFLVSSNNSIFNVVVKEYTNLPFDLYLVGGSLLLYSYIRKKELWKYFFAVLMVASSLWIRLLEPIWLAIVIAFAISTFSKSELSKSILRSGFLFLFCLVEYLAWSYFTTGVAHNPGFLNFTPLNVTDTFAAIFTGAPVVVAFTIARSWGIPFFIHAVAILGLAFRPRYVWKNKHLLFMGLIVILSMLIYFSEFYALSFQYDWWSIVATSLDRSSTFLIPISGFILFDLIMSSQYFKRESA